MQQSTCSLHPRLCRLIIYAFMLCEMFCEHTALRRLKCIRVRVYWDSYRSLFEVSHGFIPEFLVGCVLPDQLLLLLRQLEGLLYLHPFGGRLCRGWWLWWRRTTKKKKKKTEKSILHLDRKGRCVLEENKTLADIRTFTSHPKNEVSLLTLFSPVLFSQHLVWPALSFICKSTHHYLWLSSALHYSVALHHPRWPLAALPPLPRRSPLSPWSCIVCPPVASPSRDSAYSGHRDLVWRRPLSLFC